MFLCNNYFKEKKILIISIIIFLFIMIVSIFSGTININFIDFFNIFFLKNIDLNNFFDEETLKIIWNIRIPRVLTIALIGAGLSLVGIVFQGLFRNQMADPFIIGVSSGGSLGATIAIILNVNFFLNSLFIPVFAFIGSMINLIIIIIIIGFINNYNPSVLLLIGLSLNFFSSSCISLLMFINYNETNKIIFWNMGRVSNCTWNQFYFLFLIILISFFCFFLFRRELNVLTLGDEQAISLGVSVYKLRLFLMIISSLIIGIIVSISGIIGFVGLIVPHITRLIIGSNYKLLIPFSVLYGSSFLVMCDTFSRLLISPGELPIGIITAILGSPFLIFLLINNIKYKKEDKYE